MKKLISMILAFTMVMIPFASAVDTSANESIVDTTSETSNPLTIVGILSSNVIASSIGEVLTEDQIATAKAALEKAKAEEEARRKAEEAARKEQERLAYVESQRYSYNVFSITGLSAAEFNELLAPYALAGNGQALYDMEHTYGVNGIFCMAVAMIESSLGGYGPSRNSHNYWGILGRSWSSDYEGIQGFGNYIKNSGFYNGKSIESIAYTYCPPTAAQWAANVKSFMNTLWSRV